MSSNKSFTTKLNELERKLTQENRSHENDRRTRSLLTGSPGPRRPMLGNHSDGGGTSSRSSSAPSSGRRRPDMQLDCHRLAPERRRTGMQLDCQIRSRPPDSREIDQKYEEIMKQSGILTINKQKIHTEIGDLESQGELGHGTCGQVIKMKHKGTGYLMAVKQMRRSGNKEENKRIIMDLDVVLKSHDCPYIVQCIGTFITSSEVWICMELMSTCLDKLLKRTHKPIPERILGKMAVAIVRALHYLKENHGVIHRDIKPSNILLDEKGTVKLCDFGISGRLVDSKARTRTAGCAAYMAPERIDPPDPLCPDYDIRADVWSLGISLVELASGEFPYKDCKTDFEVLTKVLQEDPPLLPPGEDFSHEFCSFVRDCLTKDYKKRPKYKKLLEHTFIKRYEKESVDVGMWYTAISKTIEVKAS
ncbi:dual specificity mitogen-activated protein kinase kinase 7-like isoform X2 [Gigantopelta aegis]|uniref:dual specificity mitogen-activated protein kinase kinase 7-like isoform X2 n=1 Tax=Gigantopelta aegis TaxID=1735272 RepID=UPI001B888EC1|nr:dual specificity mitogen-activated protein kinase kinase 7-like isoform X2 [Gigantopelta aegis]